MLKLNSLSKLVFFISNEVSKFVVKHANRQNNQEHKALNTISNKKTRLYIYGRRVHRDCKWNFGGDKWTTVMT